MRQGEPVDDSGIGSGTAGNDEVNSHDVQRPQIDMKMRGQPCADAEKNGMNEINRVGVIAKHREKPVHPAGNGTAFPPVKQKEHSGQSIQHANRTELMNRKDSRQRVILQIVHDTPIRCQHAQRRQGLKDVDT